MPKDGEQLHIRVQIMLQTRGSGGMENFGGIWHANAPPPPPSLKETLIVQVTFLNFCLFHMQAETIYAGFDENGTATGG